ncbi:unnamed protein product [Calypogeia fissa]
MDHIPVIEKERAVREGRAVHDVAGGSNPPAGSDTPPEEPVDDKAVDNVLSDITAGPENLGPHEDPEGLTLGVNVEAPGLVA